MPRPVKLKENTNYFLEFYSGVKKLFWIYFFLEALAFLASAGAAAFSAGAAWEREV